MKSFGGRATVKRVKQECDKYVAENLDAIKYELFREITQENFQQAEAVMLYALMLHGYGTKRLQRVHEWVKAIMEMPEILGKTPTCADCQNVLSERHGIRFDEITVRVESREQYEKR